MAIRTAEQLGAVIRARRKQLRITQKEVAMTCGTGLRYIVDLEKGKPSCQVGKALLILHSLGLAVETMPLGGNGMEGRKP